MEPIEKIEKKTLTLQSIITAVGGIILVISPLFLWVDNIISENRNEALVAVIEKMAVTKEEFSAHASAQAEYMLKTDRRFNAYFLKIDSTLAIILPEIVENQSETFKAVKAIQKENLLRTNSGEDKYEVLLATIVEMEDHRKTVLRHKQIVDYLKEINDRQYPAALQIPVKRGIRLE